MLLITSLIIKYVTFIQKVLVILHYLVRHNKHTFFIITISSQLSHKNLYHRSTSIIFFRHTYFPAEYLGITVHNTASITPSWNTTYKCKHIFGDIRWYSIVFHIFTHLKKRSISFEETFNLF